MAFGLCLLLWLGPAGGPTPDFPYEAAGLDERRAAVHLLDRLGYGPEPGQVDAVVAMGLENWFRAQLSGRTADPALERRLKTLPALGMTAEEIFRTYPTRAKVARLAVQAGVVADQQEAQDQPQKVREFGRERGFRSPAELMHDLFGQKITRAVYAENQMHEVLTDFWFNHFYVSITDSRARTFVLSYEYEAIRPHVLGSFQDMLTASARHPAMLLYLDNAGSSAGKEAPTTAGMMAEKRRGKRNLPRRNRNRGINENYARELMELHTLGVDGGYTQQDIVEVARAFTGWTTLPADRPDAERRLRRARKLGFRRDGLFLFRADMHDAGPKTILGRKFKRGGGVEEGEKVLAMLADHPSTARFVTAKFARRFVSENPPQALLDRLAENFRKTDGNLKHLLVTLVNSPEFWADDAVDARVKSPFRLAVSALRAMNAEIDRIRPLKQWIGKMGQPLYGFQAPTGFPDEAAFWISSGNLANRMDFAVQLASGKIQGVNIRRKHLVGSLKEITARFLPERDTDDLQETLKHKAHLLPQTEGESLSQQLLASYGYLDEWKAAKPELDNKHRHAALIMGSPAFQKH
ncbi:MAG: DUF1800 domain-containing protein [Acidobacteriota bacterium]|nr:DUF1800 domain-containing protein [Acidobacteriota bacterium]